MASTASFAMLQASWQVNGASCVMGFERMHYLVFYIREAGHVIKYIKFFGFF